MQRLVFTLMLVVSLIAPGLGAGSVRAEAAQAPGSLVSAVSPVRAAPSPPAVPTAVSISFDRPPTPTDGSAQKDRQVDVNANVNGEQSGSVVTYQLNSLSATGTEHPCNTSSGTAWLNCTDWIMQFQNLPDNKYTLIIRVYAPDGVTFLKDGSTAWTIDNVAPVVAFNPAAPAAPNYTKQSPPTITFTVDDGALGSGVDAADDVECSLDGASFSDCTTGTSQNISGSLSDGAHNLRVRATDRAGNVSAIITYNWHLDKTAPNVAIAGTIPATVYTNNTYPFTFSGGDGSGSGIITYTCTVRNKTTSAVVAGPVNCGGAVATSNYLFNAAPLASDTYVFEVFSTDLATNNSAVDKRDVVVDKTAPTTTLDRTNLTPTINQGPINFTFNGSDGPSSPITYECQLESDPPSGTAPWNVCTSVHSQAIPNDGRYIFSVRAVDRSGNRDASPESFSFLFDTSAPQLVVVSPVTTSIYTKSSSLTFTFGADDSPSSDGLEFFCTMNGVVERCNEGVKTYTNLLQGTSIFTLTVKDQAGNEDSETYTIYADYTEPQTVLTGVQASPSNNPHPNFAFVGSDNLSQPSQIVFQCSIDLLDWVTCQSGIAPPEFGSLASGMHTFQVRAIDQVGNFDTTPATFIWRVDVDAPDTALNRNEGQVPPAFSPSTSATFNFSGVDTVPGPVSFECQIDNGSWNPCSNPRVFTGLVNKPYTFQVRARDQAGNVDASPELYSWTVDTIPPLSPSITAPVSGTLVNSLSVAFIGSDSGPGTIRFQCIVSTNSQADTWQDCTSPHVPQNLPDGIYWLKVRMVDQAGNTSPAPSVRRVILDKTPPDTAVVADIGAPAGFPTVTREITANFTFSATKSRPEENSTFVCALDNQAPAVCNSPRSYPGLSGGRHTFVVYATDDAGNSDLSGVVFTWTVDTQFPTTVLVPQTQPQYRNEVRPTINFRGDDEEAPGVPGSGVVAFDCEFDGQTIIPCAPADPSGNGSFTPAAPLADGVHELKLFAIDAVGHKDTTPTVYTWTQDTVRPDTINLVRTPPDAVTTTQVFTFTFEASGAEAIPPTLECKLDDGAWAACTSPHVTPPLDNGSHTFQVRAKDVAGNVDESPLTDTWVVDRAGPVVTLTGRPNAATNLSTANFTFSADDNGGSGFASAECRLDSGTWGACSTLNASYSDLAEGVHTFHVRATDQLGNVGAAITYSWTVDQTAPNTAMTGDLPALINVQSITLHFTGTDALTAEGLKFECSLDNGPFESCVNPRTFPGLTNGVHNLRVRAIDGAGNIDQTPATHEWRVEVANPVRQIHLPLVKK